jgi:hypothetical protein
LTLDRDTAAFPLERDAYYRTAMQPLRQIVWTPAQHLVRGWVPSRTPVQYLTVRPYACQAELRIVETTEPAGCAVENHLQTRIVHLMLHGAAGDLYYGHDIDQQSRARLEALDTDDKFQRAMLKMVGAQRRSGPAAPAAVATPISEW